MENRINQILTLDNDVELLVLHQAIYNGDNYLVCSKVVAEGTDLDENPILVHEIKNGDKLEVEVVEDPDLAEFIFEHLNLID